MIISAAYAAEAAHAAEHHGSLLQDPTFWVALSFCLVAALLVKPVGTALIGMLNKRADDIRNKIGEAEKIRQEAADLLEKYKEKQKSAQQEIDSLMQKTQKEIDKLKSEAQSTFEHSVKKQEEQSFKRLKNAKDEAVSEIRDMAVNISVEVTKEVLKEKLTAEQNNRLIMETIDDLPRLLKAE